MIEHVLTEDKEEVIKDEFYKPLKKALEKTAKQGMQILCGDFKARPRPAQPARYLK